MQLSCSLPHIQRNLSGSSVGNYVFIYRLSTQRTLDTFTCFSGSEEEMATIRARVLMYNALCQRLICSARAARACVGRLVAVGRFITKLSQI